MNGGWETPDGIVPLFQLGEGSSTVHVGVGVTRVLLQQLCEVIDGILPVTGKVDKIVPQ